MAQTEELKPQLYNKISLTPLTFDLTTLKSNSQLLHIELIRRIDKEGVIINPRYFFCPTPTFLEELDKNITHEHPFMILQGMLADIESRQQQLPSSSLFYRDEVFLRKSLLVGHHQPEGDYLSRQLLHLEQALEEAKVSSLAGLVNPVLRRAEPSAVVERQSLSSPFVQGHKEHEGDDGRPSPPLPMIAMHCDNCRAILFLKDIILPRYSLIWLAI